MAITIQVHYTQKEIEDIVKNHVEQKGFELIPDAVHWMPAGGKDIVEFLAQAKPINKQGGV